MLGKRNVFVLQKHPSQAEMKALKLFTKSKDKSVVSYER